MGIAALLIFIFDIVAIADCVRSPRDAGHKVLWVVLILLLPFVGMILYFLLAKRTPSSV